MLRLVVVLLLAGCAAAPSPASDAARDVLLECHAVKARELDDRQSDAATIGRAVHRACITLATEAMNRARGASVNVNYYAAFDAEFMRGAEAHATQAVLENRAKR